MTVLQPKLPLEYKNAFLEQSDRLGKTSQNSHPRKSVNICFFNYDLKMRIE